MNRGAQEGAVGDEQRQRWFCAANMEGLHNRPHCKATAREVKAPRGSPISLRHRRIVWNCSSSNAHRLSRVTIGRCLEPVPCPSRPGDVLHLLTESAVPLLA